MTMTKHVAGYSNRNIAAFTRGWFHDDDGGDRLKAALLRVEDPIYAARTITIAEIKKTQQVYFPDMPLDNSAQSILRLASNVSVGREEKVDMPLAINLDMEDGDRDISNDGDFIHRFIIENAVSTDVATLYFKIAEKFQVGEGVKQNEKRAHYWLHLAAEGRYRPAEKLWGDVLKKQGDLESAAQWYHKAALRGDVDAQRELAFLLRDHQITSLDDSWEKWMEIACKGAGTSELPQ